MIQVHCRKGQTILQACQKQGILVDGVCGGSGNCGKCKMKIMRIAPKEGDAGQSRMLPPSEKDIRLLSGQELEQGFRLACAAVPEEDCDIRLVDTPIEEMAVVTSSREVKRREETDACFHTHELAVVADIGTTTLAMQLVACTQNETKVLATYTAVNAQRSFGAEVLSRIEASNARWGDALKDALLRGIAEGMEALTEPTAQAAFSGSAADAGDKADSRAAGSAEPARLVLAGNTTMVHLLMGYSCETLGRAQFRPVSTDSIRMKAEPLLKPYLTEKTAALLKETELFVFPGISAFVGGDIVAGLYVTGFYKSADVQILLDLGTNGEIVIGNRMRMLAASTAAGPAFEGGGISCGSAGVRGAVCGCTMRADGSFDLTTIGGAKPTGICGSGIIEILYELLKAGRIDETGLLDGGESERVILYGDTIYLTQKDIRQFQMAKAAVCAGIETLVREYGVQPEEVAALYVAGGFGYSIDLKKAAAIGLFPKGYEDRLTAIGNSALAGCRAYLLEKDEKKLSNICRYSAERNLAQSDDFKEAYLARMYFPSGA
ncbi:MAG: DUF4445 domain-containing protein [Lachnospiraceae bacterium]|nr:DUF4445 domain-containing protein [Lachnospiraceae bacterium]